jgi:predicted nucleotidyltransferase
VRLTELLNKWDQQGDEPVAVALKKRTNNHHLRSTLSLENSYLDVKFSKMILGTHDQFKILSDYGVEQAKLKGESGLKKWHQDTIEKINSTRLMVKKDIEEISGILIKKFNLPIQKSKKGVRIALVSYYARANREIVNKTSEERMKSTFYFYAAVKTLEFIVPSTLEDQLVSFYVTGSVARGEAKLGMSDLNLVIITKDELGGLDVKLKRIMTNAIKKASGILVDVDITVLSKEEFLKAENFKIAFICHTDGLLVRGEDLTKLKKFPLPGLGLAYLLNQDFKKKIEELEKYLEETEDVSEEEGVILLRKLIKDTLRMQFAEVMANHAVYANKIIKIKEFLLWAHPQNSDIVTKLYKCLRGRVCIDKSGFRVIIQEVCRNKLFPLLDDLEGKTKDWLEQWKGEY